MKAIAFSQRVLRAPGSGCAWTRDRRRALGRPQLQQSSRQLAAASPRRLEPARIETHVPLLEQRRAPACEELLLTLATALSCRRRHSSVVGGCAGGLVVVVTWIVDSPLEVRAGRVDDLTELL